jgi:hypothetical protein
MRNVVPSLAALAVCAFGSVVQAAPGGGNGLGTERMQVWASDHEAMLNAGLAGLKAGLKLTPDQEKLWPPFEAAVRDAVKLRMNQMKGGMERMQSMGDMDMTEPMRDGRVIEDNRPAVTFSLDRLEAMAKRMSERSAAMLNVAEAAKPFYASLDDAQKRLFGLLGGEMLMMGHGRHGMGMIGSERMGMKCGGGMGMMGGDGMGKMRDMGMQGGQGMGTMQNQPDDDEDNTDDQ